MSAYAQPQFKHHVCLQGAGGILQAGVTSLCPVPVHVDAVGVGEGTEGARARVAAVVRRANRGCLVGGSAPGVAAVQVHAAVVVLGVVLAVGVGAAGGCILEGAALEELLEVAGGSTGAMDAGVEGLELGLPVRRRRKAYVSERVDAHALWMDTVTETRHHLAELQGHDGVHSAEDACVFKAHEAMLVCIMAPPILIGAGKYLCKTALTRQCSGRVSCRPEAKPCRSPGT